MHLHQRLLALAAAALPASAAPASAQTTDPACRGSAARVTLPPLAESEPAAANATVAGCATVVDTAPVGRRIDCGAGRDRLRANRDERKRLTSCEAPSPIR